MTDKIMLPMAANAGREYTVTLSEQQDLARRYGLRLEAVKASLEVLQSRMLSGEVDLQKTANKTRQAIAAHIEQQ